MEIAFGPLPESENTVASVIWWLWLSDMVELKTAQSIRVLVDFNYAPNR